MYIITLAWEIYLGDDHIKIYINDIMYVILGHDILY